MPISPTEEKNRPLSTIKENSENLLSYLKARKKLLSSIICQKQQSLSKAPRGSLHVAKRGKYKSYYLRNDSSDKTGVYIRKKDIIIAKSAAQGEYDSNLIEQAGRELSLIEELINSINQIQNPSSFVHPSKRELILPITAPDIDFISEWINKSYNKISEFDIDNEYYSTNGQQVRSKSELMIANALERNHIPYRYEFPIELKNGVTVYPDFLCLNTRLQKEIIFEHFGLMDSAEYSDNVILKIKNYELSGYTLGNNFIFTMESGSSPLSTKWVEQQISTYLL